MMSEYGHINKVKIDKGDDESCVSFAKILMNIKNMV